VLGLPIGEFFDFIIRTSAGMVSYLLIFPVQVGFEARDDAMKLASSTSLIMEPGGMIALGTGLYRRDVDTCI
jgi:hypothetical protein